MFIGKTMVLYLSNMNIFSKNDGAASPIDFVDIGFPNGNYSLSNVTATVDGNIISDISRSPYVTYGVALGLGSNSIGAGQMGTVEMIVTGIDDVLYEDNHDNAYASAVFFTKLLW